MPSQPERILLIRSGRHLSVALETLRRVFPGCTVTVVATPGAQAALAREGLGPEACFIYDAAPAFDAWPLFRGGLYRRLRRAGFDRVAVLWQDPEGSDRANVDRTAFLLSPAGFTAITPDGVPHDRRCWPVLAQQAHSGIASLVTLAVLGVFLYGPARLARLGKR